ncbi:MAG TPA: DUF47 family protein [Solirubrobacteraceae bacterium]|jgi:uncharacterized protein|nr:DUF47 family protein [Solirubrobacteraceae bacterium]
MKPHHWFLPDTPDVLGLLRAQVAITIEGLDAFAAWAGGDTAAAEALKDAEHRGDVAKRELVDALRAAFVTPLEPEDLFALSRIIDRILSSSREVVAEADVLAVGPDGEVAEMAQLISRAVRWIDEAIAQLGADAGRATAAADEAIATEKALDQVYYRGMAALLDADERSARIAGRELYRRCARIGDLVVEVAERVIYAVVKQS